MALARDRRKAGTTAQPRPQTVGQFVAANCQTGDPTDSTFRVFARPLYLSYLAFCQASGHAVLSRCFSLNTFASKIGRWMRSC